MTTAITTMKCYDLERIHESQIMKFIPWGPTSIQVAAIDNPPTTAQVSSSAVTGFMLANHTCMAELFSNLLVQYDCLKSRNAFLDNYQKEPMFNNNLDEFDLARDTDQLLVDEYRACEHLDYVNFGL